MFPIGNDANALFWYFVILPLCAKKTRFAKFLLRTMQAFEVVEGVFKGRESDGVACLKGKCGNGLWGGWSRKPPALSKWG